MRKSMAVLVATALLATALVSDAEAKPPKRAIAVKAVKEAVQEKFPQFSTVPAYLNVSQTRISVPCTRLSASKFKCRWNARNNLDEHAWGGARVTIYSGGGDATLRNVRCEKRYGTC